MKLYIGVTDYDWFNLHASKEKVEEVNFWRPSPNSNFNALEPGEMFLFKLHSPRNFIAGGGFFARFLKLPVSLAWDAFGEANGATSLEEIRKRIIHYRRDPVGEFDDPEIGCILLQEPFFFEEDEWIPIPENFKLNTVQGKGYNTDEEIGYRLWREVGERISRLAAKENNPGPALKTTAETARYGKPTIVHPRLGQGTFRIYVTDAYNRRCAITAEKTLPVLEAAHIRPYSKGGLHEPSNGLLLRSDLHKLYDRGYLTVDPDEKRVLVSRRIREEFENGREYYALEGKRINQPDDFTLAPARENLFYHASNIFKE